MKIELVSMGWLPYVRRRMRKAGIRLTVRWGKVYTVMAAETRQPDSAAQLRAREVLARASEAAKKELADPERRQYWTMNAAEMGYKTVRGACVAYHVRRLKEEAQTVRTEMASEECKEVTDRVLTKVELQEKDADRRDPEARPTAEEVMRAIRLGNLGMGFLWAGSKRPSRWSFSLSCS